MGVDMLGFRVIAGSEYHITAPVFQEIRGWISGPKIVAELYNISSSAQIEEAVRTFAPDLFELTWNEYLAYEKHLDLPCIVYAPGREALLAAAKNPAIRYLLAGDEISCRDTGPVSCPVLVNIRSLEEMRKRESEACFHGYVLDGPKELRPGITNYDQLGAILEALEED
jgi:phosphoribosylanthranilate isomerase